MIELIPAIDIIDGRCVRLTRGDYLEKKVYASDPAETAAHFGEMGIRRLHVVDLDGARAGRVVNLEVLERICSETSLVVDFGGGLKTEEDVRRVFDAGAEMVTAGSIAVNEPETVERWLHLYSAEKIILGADARQGMIAIHGWQEDTSIDLVEFIRGYMAKGIQKIICTDIEVDGTLTGPTLDLYRRLKKEFPGLEIIASGGVSAVSDLYNLDATGIDGVIFGKAYYEGRITETDIRNILKT